MTINKIIKVLVEHFGAFAFITATAEVLNQRILELYVN
jgi:hypothetical protein